MTTRLFALIYTVTETISILLIGSVLMGKGGEVEMSLDEVVRCLGVNFLLMGYFVCATLVHIAINSSKILKRLGEMNKDKQEGR